MDSDTPFLETYDGQSTGELIALEGKFRTDSIVLAFAAALQVKDELSEAERVILSVKAIISIGCPQTAGRCQEAIDLIGVEDLFDSGALEDAACEADDDLMERFNALDETYYAGTEEPITDKLFEFIKENKTDVSLT